MDMAKQLDPAALAAIINANKNKHYARGCAVGNMIAGLDPGPFRDRLVELMNTPTNEVNNVSLAAAIQQTIGVTYNRSAIGHHRRRSCSCSNEVFT